MDTIDITLVTVLVLIVAALFTALLKLAGIAAYGWWLPVMFLLAAIVLIVLIAFFLVVALRSMR